MIKELSKAANLSKVYTNPCIRATAITLWSDAGLSNLPIIMTLSGHRNVPSRATTLDQGRSSSRSAVTFSHLPWIQRPHKSISNCKFPEGTSTNFYNLDPLLVLWYLTSKTLQGTMSDSTSQPSSRAAKSGKFTLLLRAITHSDIHLEVLSLENSKFFELSICFHRTLDISKPLKYLGGFKADIAFVYTTLACLLAHSTNLNLILTFLTWNFIGPCVIRCALWLVSRKNDCLQRVLRKKFCIKR